jgi:hypothetical protein
MTAEALPIAEFVEHRRREIDLGKADVVRRCGYRNLSKGLRRLDALYAGELEGEAPAAIIRCLPEALGVDQEIVDAVVSATREIIDARMRAVAAVREAAWRATFEPHAYLVTERAVPMPITICALTGGPDRWLRITLDTTRPPLTFAQQAIAAVRREAAIPFYGAVIGVIVNYSPDRAVRFDLEGNPVHVYDRAYSPGEITVSLGRRPLSPGEIELLLGGR